MKASLFPAARFLALSLVVGWLSNACNGKVNDSQPNLMTTVRVSLSSNNEEGNLDAVQDQIGVSNTGRFISFTSRASNLVAGDNNNVSDVFLRDNLNRTLTLVSISLTGGPANGASGQSAVSGDGNYVVFASLATNLTNDVVIPGKRQIYVRDVPNNVTTLVSRATGATGLIASEDCNNPRISNDGTCVAFDSLASNLDGVAGGGDDNDAFIDVWRRRWIDGTSAFPTDLVSFASGSTSPGGTKGNQLSTKPSISADGRYIAFESGASNLVAAGADGGPDLNVTTDVFVRDMQAARTVRCSVELPGTLFPNALVGPALSPSISLDGLLVTFRSTSGLLSVLAPEQNPNIYVRSWFAVLPDVPFTEVLSVHTSGATGGAGCERPTISGDGKRIAWQSPSPALVNGDSNGVLDVFLRDRTAQATSRESVQTFGGQLDGQSGAPTYSPDGRYIVFWSQATNGVDDDTNGAADIYMRGPPFK
jgi:Tol biopolymer transport system component